MGRGAGAISTGTDRVVVPPTCCWGHLNAETMSFEPLRAGGSSGPRGGFRFLQPTPGLLPPVSSPFKPTPTCTPHPKSVTYVLEPKVLPMY